MHMSVDTSALRPPAVPQRLDIAVGRSHFLGHLRTAATAARVVWYAVLLKAVK